MFQAAAECYDRQEERKLAARYYALAGQTFFDLDDRLGKKKAASAYGKAIFRFLMADDFQGAIFLLDKGKSQGFSTYHFQMAEEALERKIQELGLAIPEKPAEAVTRRHIILPRIAPVSESFEVAPEIVEVLIEKEEVMPVLETFAIDDPIDEEQITEDISQALLESISETFYASLPVEASSTVDFITASGDKITLKPQMTLVPISETVKELGEGLSLTEHERLRSPTELPAGTFLDEKDEITIQDLEREKTAFDTVSEVLNELEEPITDVEVVDRIPFAWQVVGVDGGDMTLTKREVTTGGLLFTWTKDRLIPGERAQIKYHLRKRIHRSVVMRKGKKISLLSSYHSLCEKKSDLLSAEIPWTNVSGEPFDEVLIEDSAPVELILRSYSPKMPALIKISGIDESLFRWIFADVIPGFQLFISYDFIEKPVTRWFERQFEDNKGTKVKIRKIAQPNPEAIVPETFILFELRSNRPIELSLSDVIPTDAEIIAVNPSWLIPHTRTERNRKIISWLFKLTANDPITVVVRLHSRTDYTAGEPIIEFSSYEIMEGREIRKKREKQSLDLLSFSSRN